jgi:hypothetical protein
MRLFHFSDDLSIEVFVPRPVRVPSSRRPGFAWLNGPLVWAIDAWHQPMYLFPRHCPRTLFWFVATTTDADRAQYFGGLTRFSGPRLHYRLGIDSAGRAIDDLDVK